jgi:hypothetical protein
MEAISLGMMMWSLTLMIAKPNSSPRCANVARLCGVAIGPRVGSPKPNSIVVPPLVTVAAVIQAVSPPRPRSRGSHGAGSEGDRDPITLIVFSEGIVASFPADLVPFERFAHCGQSVHWDDPERAFGVLREFILP